MTSLKRMCGAIALIAAASLSPAAHAEQAISVELNKLEPLERGCRVYMVFKNATGAALTSYKPDLVFFDKNGVIADRLVVEGAPLPAGKTKVKLFDVVSLACPDIARVLLNDVRACDGAGQQPADCLAMTNTSSLGTIEFIK